MGLKTFGLAKGSGILPSAFLLYLALQAFAEEPFFSEPIPNVTVTVGRDATLPCVVENLGHYRVAWMHIDRQMILTIHKHIITRIPRFSVTHDSHKTWLLHISDVQREDEGLYMCQVNTEPMIHKIGHLKVVVPPNIVDSGSSKSKVAVRENANVTLRCQADGFPKPNITWKREDGRVITLDRQHQAETVKGETLNLTRVSRADMGAYLCIARNDVPPAVSKRIVLQVEFPPTIHVPDLLVGARLGSSVTLQCNTEAYPPSINYWVRDENMLLKSTKYSTNASNVDPDGNGAEYKTSMRLTIRNIDKSDLTSYRCVAKNSLGTTEGSIQLYEIPSPSTTQAPRQPPVIERDQNNWKDDRHQRRKNHQAANNEVEEPLQEKNGRSSSSSYAYDTDDVGEGEANVFTNPQYPKHSLKGNSATDSHHIQHTFRAACWTLIISIIGSSFLATSSF